MTRRADNDPNPLRRSPGGFGVGLGAGRGGDRVRLRCLGGRRPAARESAARGAPARSRRPHRAKRTRRPDRIGRFPPAADPSPNRPSSPRPVQAVAERGSWLHVRLPGRPNSHKGWISTNRTRLTSTGWRILVKLSTRRVTVYHGDRARRHFRAVVGKPSTPTPRGSFFIEEALALSSYETGGPFALATSARSNVFQEFEGGPGQIGIHGTTTSRALSGRRLHTAASGSALVQSLGWRDASAPAFH